MFAQAAADDNSGSRSSSSGGSARHVVRDLRPDHQLLGHLLQLRNTRVTTTTTYIIGGIFID